jgi:hypothetical protein
MATSFNTIIMLGRVKSGMLVVKQGSTRVAVNVFVAATASGWSVRVADKVAE